MTTISPVQATGLSVEPREGARHGGGGLSLTLIIVGAVPLALGIVVGLATPLGVLISFVGGVLSFTGIAIGGAWIMPPLLGLAARLLPPRPAIRIASGSIARFPTRSGRSTIGLVIGVTLVTMFAVAMRTFGDALSAQYADDPLRSAALSQQTGVATAILAALVGFSAVIAAVGLVNTLALGVLQRSREIGVLRVVGATSRQVGVSILTEAAVMSVTAVVSGLVLGTIYGWVAAQSVAGSFIGGLILPSIPWELVGLIVVASVLLAVVASLAPSRRARRLSPIGALALD